MIVALRSLVLYTAISVTGCVTRQYSYIRVYKDQTGVSAGYAKGICDKDGAGFLPRIDTLGKLELYKTIQDSETLYANMAAGFWTNSTRDSDTDPWLWDDETECYTLSQGSQLWLEPYQQCFLERGFDLFQTGETCTAYADSGGYGLVPRHCSTLLNIVVCERISHGDYCQFDNHPFSEQCPDSTTGLGQQILSGVQAEQECKDLCSDFSSGTDECWAILYDSSTAECTLLYFTNPWFLQQLWTSTHSCPGKTYFHKICYRVEAKANTFSVDSVCSSVSCSILRGCTSVAATTTSSTTTTTTSTTSSTTTSTSSATATPTTTKTPITTNISTTNNTTTTPTTSTTSTTTATTLTTTSTTPTTASTLTTTSTTLTTTSTTPTTASTLTTTSTTSTPITSNITNSTTPTSSRTTTPITTFTPTTATTATTTETTTTASATTNMPSTNTTASTAFNTTTNTFSDNQTSITQLSTVQSGSFATSDSSTDSLLTSSTSSSVIDMCSNTSCLCFNETFSNLTIEELLRELKIDMKSTSAYKRTKLSVEDKRLEAKAMGFVGVIVIVFILSLFIVSDILSNYTKVFKKQQET